MRYVARMHLTEAHAAEIEADCLDALEYLSGNRAMSKDSIGDAMQPKRPATRAVLEAATADHPLASIVEDVHPNVRIWLILGRHTIASLADYLRHEGYGDHAGRIEAGLEQLQAASQRH
jgi:hypothetical protein